MHAPRIRYQFVQQWEGQYCVATLCKVMQVSRSAFYAWKGRKPSERQKENEVLLCCIRPYFERSNKTYGSRRIFRDLKESGVFCSRYQVAQVMRKAGLTAVVAPRFVVTTDSKHSLPVATNLLNQHFGAPDANVKWASDITYIWTKEGWLYLAVVRVQARLRWICFLERWLVGVCRRHWNARWFCPLCKQLFCNVNREKDCCIIATGVANMRVGIISQRFRSAGLCAV